MNIHDACFNLYFVTCEYYDPLKSHDDLLSLSSESHADSLYIYNPAVGSPGTRTFTACLLFVNTHLCPHSTMQSCIIIKDLCIWSEPTLKVLGIITFKIMRLCYILVLWMVGSSEHRVIPSELMNRGWKYSPQNQQPSGGTFWSWKLRTWKPWERRKACSPWQWCRDSNKQSKRSTTLNSGRSASEAEEEDLALDHYQVLNLCDLRQQLRWQRPTGMVAGLECRKMNRKVRRKKDWGATYKTWR